jgi:hypothetical protein
MARHYIAIRIVRYCRKSLVSSSHNCRKTVESVHGAKEFNPFRAVGRCSLVTPGFTRGY